MDMVEIKCNCKVCKANAAKLGLTAPLRAEVPAKLLAQTKGKTHGWVLLAHDPCPVWGQGARDRTGVRAL